MRATDDLAALAATAEQMCSVFTIGPAGTSYRIDDVSVRAVQAAVPGLIAEVERLRGLVGQVEAECDAAEAMPALVDELRGGRLRQRLPVPGPEAQPGDGGGMTDWITCGAGLGLDARRRLHTGRTRCWTMVPLDGQTAPVICPSCGSRVA